jgi:uncharacterized membrane protein YidH (DUF202 family)
VATSTSTRITADAQEPVFPVVHARDSTARDHLSNEVAFLAWLRTALTCTAMSIPLYELLRETPFRLAPIGTLFVSIGVLTFCTRRYFLNSHLLQERLFRINRRGVLAMAGVGLVMSVSLIGILYVAQYESLVAGKLSVKIKAPAQPPKECK